MSRFDKTNFKRIVSLMEQEENQGKNIDLALGIFEYMYDDDCGYLDQYFHSPAESRNIDSL